MKNNNINSKNDIINENAIGVLNGLDLFFKSNYLTVKDDPNNIENILKFLLKSFDGVYDKWIDTYNELDSKKMESRNLINTNIKSLLKTRLDKTRNKIEDFYPNKENPIIMYARIMHLANKIAHRYEDFTKSTLETYSNHYKMFNYEKFYEKELLTKHHNFSVFNKADTVDEVSRYIDYKSEYIENKDKNNAKAKLCNENAEKIYEVIKAKTRDQNLDEDTRKLYESELKKLDYIIKTLPKYGLNFRDARILFRYNKLNLAMNVRKNSFAMKDDYRIKIHKYIVDNSYTAISYGEHILDCGNNKYEKLFYIDVPGYGQISVHFQNTDYIDGYPEIPCYQMPFDSKEARREPIILIKDYSKSFRDFKTNSENSNNPYVEKIIPHKKDIYKKKFKIACEIIKKISFTDKKNTGVTDENIKSIRHHLAIISGMPKDLLLMMYNSENMEDFLKNVGLLNNKSVLILHDKQTGDIADIIVNDLPKEEAKRKLQNRVKKKEKPINYTRKVQNDNAVKKLREAREARHAARQAVRQELKTVKKRIKISKRQEKSERRTVYSNAMRKKISERFKKFVNKKNEEKGEER